MEEVITNIILYSHYITYNQNAGEVTDNCLRRNLFGK